MQLEKEIKIDEDLICKVLRHFKLYGYDYAKSLGKDIGMNKRDACRVLKELYSMGYLDKRKGGMLKRKDAKLKKRTVTEPHHTYYTISEKGEEYLKNCKNII